jgi:predicted negative regulator of RcsB-dependent stress response
LRAVARDPLDAARPFGWRDRADWTRLGIVVGVAFALRLAFFFLNKAFNPTFYFPVVDSLYHHEWALDLVAGGTPGPDAFYRGPLYPYFLAVLYKLSGSSIAFAVFVNHLMGALTAGLIYVIARELFSRSVSMIAGLTVALYWVLVYMEGDLLMETLFIFLNSLCLLLLTIGIKRHKLRILAAGGLALGLATIARPSVMVFFPAVPLAIWLAARNRPGTPGWLKQSVVVALACALPIMPVMIRNYMVARAVVPVGASGGLNFYIGNNPLSDGSTAIVPGTRADFWGGFEDAIAIAEKRRRPQAQAGGGIRLLSRAASITSRSIRAMPRALMGRNSHVLGRGERATKIIYSSGTAKMKYVPLPRFLAGRPARHPGALPWRRRADLAMFYFSSACTPSASSLLRQRALPPAHRPGCLFYAYAAVPVARVSREAVRDGEGVARGRGGGGAGELRLSVSQANARVLGGGLELHPGRRLKMGSKGTALSHYARADEINRQYPTPGYRLIERDVDYKLGSLLWEEGMCSRAIEVLERVGGNDELALHALDCLGDCYLKRNDVGNATRAFQKLASISPQDQRGVAGLARCFAATGDYAQAETMLHQIVDPRRAVYPPAYIALAEVQRAQGKIDEAIASYSHIAQLVGYQRQGYMALVELYRQKGDVVAALKALDQAALYSPPNDPAIRELAGALRSGR